MTAKEVVIGIDLGGSHLEVGLVDSFGTVLSTRESNLDANEITPSEAVALVKSLVTVMINDSPSLKGSKIIAAGLGCPGQSVGDILIAASNFPKFVNVPFVRLISEAFGGISVTLLNDADAAVCAEVWGNPSVYNKYSSIAMITLGTGIGCGLILNGQLFQGSNGLIEAGHMIVTNSSHSRPCGCGQRGCVEAYSSARNTVKRLQEMDLLDNATSSTAMDGKDVFARYHMNDFNAVKVVEETAEHLAVLCINICRVIDPDVIIFGGGLSKAGAVLLDLIKKYVREKTWTVLPTDVKLNLSITDKGGVVGAALAARKKFESTKRDKPMSTTNIEIEKKEPIKEAVEDNLLNNSVLGGGILVSTAVLFMVARGNSSTQSSITSYVRDLFLIGQASLGIALLLRR